MTAPPSGPSSRPPPRRVPTEALVPREARRIQGNRAGFVTRLGANLIDLVVIAVIVLLAYGGWTLLEFSLATTGIRLPEVEGPVMIVVGVITTWLYLASAWATTGRTLGARVMGVRVVSYRGRVMRLPGAGLRAAFCMAFMPGLLWVLVSKENRSLQDTVLRTSVIHDWTRRPPKREPGVKESSRTDVP